MTIKVIKDNNYTNQILARDIHGKYPYKLYLEIKGNSLIGRYIVVVSNKQLNKECEIDEIVVQLKESSIDKTTNKSIFKKDKNNNGILRPNMINGSAINTYRVIEKSILDVSNIPLTVYKPL